MIDLLRSLHTQPIGLNTSIPLVVPKEVLYAKGVPGKGVPGRDQTKNDHPRKHTKGVMEAFEVHGARCLKGSRTIFRYKYSCGDGEKKHETLKTVDSPTREPFGAESNIIV